jgi:hypothetical protein
VNVGSTVRSTSAGDLYRVNAEPTRLLFWQARNASRLAPVACAAMLISALEAATVPGNRLWQSFAIRASSAGRCAPAASVIRPRLMPYMPAFQDTIVCTRECPGHSSLSMPHAQSVTHPCPEWSSGSVPTLRTVRHEQTVRLLSARQQQPRAEPHENQKGAIECMNRPETFAVASYDSMKHTRRRYRPGPAAPRRSGTALAIPGRAGSRPPSQGGPGTACGEAGTVEPRDTSSGAR